MTVGVPREVKDGEHRVAITPDGVRELVAHGVTVLVETGAGRDSAITDADYAAAGAEIVGAADDVWARAEMVLKVKEPQADEFRHLRPDLVLFTYLHLAAYPEVADGARSSTARPASPTRPCRCDGALPLLAPMSEVAGRMATQVGRALPRARARRPRRAARRCPRRAARRGSSCSAPATSGGTARGSRRAWRPRSSCSTRTSTGCAGSTRSTRAAS